MMISYQVTIYRLSAICYNIGIVVLGCYSYTMSSSPYIAILVQYRWPLNMAVMVKGCQEISHPVCWGSV